MGIKDFWSDATDWGAEDFATPQQQDSSTTWQNSHGNGATQDAMSDSQSSDGSWWDSLTDGSSWSSDTPAQESSQSASESESESQGGSWWDKLMDSDSEEQSKQSSESNDESWWTLDGEDTSLDGEDTTLDGEDTTLGGELGLQQLAAVKGRSATLDSRIETIYMASETIGGRFVDPAKQTLKVDINTFYDDYCSLRDIWDCLVEDQHSSWLASLNGQADSLSSRLDAYSGDEAAQDAKSVAQLRIISSSMAGIQRQVGDAEMFLRYDKTKVDGLTSALANQKLVAQVNVATSLVSAALGLTPFGVIGVGISIVQMGINPSASGAAETGAGAYSEAVNASKAVSGKLAGVGGAVVSGISAVQTARKDRAEYDRIYGDLQAALRKMQGSSAKLNGLMLQYDAKLAAAQSYAAKAT